MDAVLDEIATWQARPLEPVYPLVFFDALRVKVRDEGLVRNKAVHIVRAVEQRPNRGCITKLKLVRRQMYGRGKLDLLRARLLVPASPWPVSGVSTLETDGGS
jgi:transposase